MDLRSGHPFWLVRNGILQDYPALTRNVRCDVVVIGGGVTGALVAFQLVSSGLDVVVLDRRDIGWGSTAATTALLQYEIDTPLYRLAEMVGEDHAARAYLACRDSIAKLERLVRGLGDDCGFERKKSLYYATRRADVPALRREFRIRRKHGIRLEWLNARDVALRFPFEKPGALLSFDAAQVDAFQLTHALMRKAAATGLRVFDRTAVAAITVGKTALLTTDRGATVRAKYIVFASGYESQVFLKKKVARLISTYALVSEPLPALPRTLRDHLIWETARPYLYLRTDGERVIVGGEDEDFRDPERRDSLISSKAKRLQRKFRRLFPDQPLQVAYAWAGTFGETADGLAYIGANPEWPCAFFALGYGGNGITYSTLAAEIIRDAILGRRNEHADLFGFNRELRPRSSRSRPRAGGGVGRTRGKTIEVGASTQAPARA